MRTQFKYLLGAALCLLATLTTTHAGGKGKGGGGNQTATARIAILAPVVDHKTGRTTLQILSIDADGTQAKQLTTHGGAWPVWSHDQKYIAYNTTYPTVGSMVYILNVKTGRELPVVQVSDTGHDWWPGDSGIVYTGDEGGVWFVSVDLATGAVGTPVLLRDGVDGACFDPKVSPDATKLAYVRYGVVRVFDLNTQTEVTIPYSNYAPSWSPDGQQIAFGGIVCYGDTSHCHSEIVICNPDGTGWTPVTALQNYSSFPAWSPDGTQIAFYSQISGSKAVYKTTIGSGTVSLLYDGAREGMDWNP